MREVTSQHESERERERERERGVIGRGKGIDTNLGFVLVMEYITVWYCLARRVCITVYKVQH